METKLDHLHEIVSDKENCSPPIAPVHVLENRFFQSWQRCFSDFFPFRTHRKGSSESKSGSVSNAHNNPSMARTTMVSRATKNVCKKPTTERSCIKVESTHNAEFTVTSDLDNLRQTYLQKE